MKPGFLFLLCLLTALRAGCSDSDGGDVDVDAPAEFAFVEGTIAQAHAAMRSGTRAWPIGCSMPIARGTARRSAARPLPSRWRARPPQPAASPPARPRRLSLRQLSGVVVQHDIVFGIAYGTEYALLVVGGCSKHRQCLIQGTGQTLAAEIIRADKSITSIQKDAQSSPSREGRIHTCDCVLFGEETEMIGSLHENLNQVSTG